MEILVIILMLFSDILGGTCLIIGCLFYFFKQRPFRSITRRTRVKSSSSTEMKKLILMI